MPRSSPEISGSRYCASHEGLGVGSMLSSIELNVVRSTSCILKAWKGQSEGDSMHINRAPCAGTHRHSIWTL